jgi:hypothetical protein
MAMESREIVTTIERLGAAEAKVAADISGEASPGWTFSCLAKPVVVNSWSCTMATPGETVKLCAAVIEEAACIGMDTGVLSVNVLAAAVNVAACMLTVAVPGWTANVFAP